MSNSAKLHKFVSLFSYLIFWGIAFGYFWFFANHVFFVQEQESLFLTTSEYFQQHLLKPGGLLVFSTQLLKSFYYFPIAGALILASVLLLIVVFSSGIGKIISGKPVYFIPFVIGSVLLWLQTAYSFQLVNLTGVLVQLVLFYILLNYFRTKSGWVTVLLFPIWYFVTGAFSFLFFAFIPVLLRREEKHWLKYIVFVVFTIGFLFVADHWLFSQTTISLLTYPFVDPGSGFDSIIFKLLLLLVGVAPFVFIIYSKMNNSVIAFLKWSPVLILVILLVLLPSRIDKRTNHYFAVEKAFVHQNYNEVIRLNRQDRSGNKLTLYQNNIALAEQGRLNSELFNFRQSTDGETLFLKWQLIKEILKQGGYYYYALGIVNEANRWAYEHMVTYGYTPQNLKLLIRCEIVNGNYKVAEKYIRLLENTFFYKKEARKFECVLYDEEAINKHPEFGQKRQLIPKNDFFILSTEPQLNIDSVLTSDSTHIMALQYKLATLLIRKDVRGLVNWLPVLDKMGVTQLPKHVEEAVITMKILNPEGFPALTNIRINKQTETRFLAFSDTFKKYSNNKMQAQKALWPHYGNTYWYYVFFR